MLLYNSVPRYPSRITIIEFVFFMRCVGVMGSGRNWCVGICWVLFLAFIAGYVLFVVFEFAPDQNRSRSTQCIGSNCSITATLCGTDCSRYSCSNVICLFYAMTLDVPMFQLTLNNYTTNNDVLTGDLEILNNPPNCSQAFVGWPALTCWYDRENPNTTISIWEYFVDGTPWITAVFILWTVPLLPMIIALIVLSCSMS